MMMIVMATAARIPTWYRSQETSTVSRRREKSFDQRGIIPRSAQEKEVESAKNGFIFTVEMARLSRDWFKVIPRYLLRQRFSVLVLARTSPTRVHKGLSRGRYCIQKFESSQNGSLDYVLA